MCFSSQGKHSAILSTFIKLPFVIKIFVLSIFEWPFYTGFTVIALLIRFKHENFNMTINRVWHKFYAIIGLNFPESEGRWNKFCHNWDSTLVILNIFMYYTPPQSLSC